MRRFLILTLVVIALGACTPLPDTNAPSTPGLSSVTGPIPQHQPSLSPSPLPTATLPGDWKTFNSIAGGFSISIPNLPTEQAQTVDTSFGRVELHMSVDDTPGTAYSVGYSDYPVQAIQNAKIPDLLAFAVNGAIKNVGAKLLSRTFGSQDQVQGVEFKGEIPPSAGHPVGEVVQGRMFLRGNRLYQVIVVFTRGQDQQAQVYRFLDSFHFLSQ